MKLMCNCHMYLASLLGTILLLHLQVRADTTKNLLTTTESPAIPTTPNPTETSGALTTKISEETATYTMRTTTFESTPQTQPATFGSTFIVQMSTSQSPSDTSTTPQLPSTPPPEAPISSYTVTSTDQELVTLGEGQIKAELCEENNKRLMLICLIIIGVLIFICVCLLMAVVAMANKLSYVKRRQPSKRLPRSNGDFLSASSLWPVGLETLQRMTHETTGTDQVTQSLGPERTNAGQGKAGEEVSKKLASEVSDRQKQKEVSAKSPNSATTNVEI